jgi:hypothetical protein
MSDETNSAEIVWLTAEGEGPEWARSVAVYDGRIFVPGAIGEHEFAVLLGASWDGNVPMIQDSDHSYFPSDWMKKEFPDKADVIEMIERKVLACLTV